MIDRWYRDNLVCPRDRTSLDVSAAKTLTCANGHSYPIVDGIPVMIVDDAPPTIALADASVREARGVGDVESSQHDDLFVSSLGLSDHEKEALRQSARDSGGVDPVVSYLVGATNGIAYTHLIGRLREYPIPEIPLPDGAGRSILDVGCSWGRWCIAAARKGYQPVGIDPSLGAVVAARRVARQLGLDIAFVVGDARFLPFRSDAFDAVFSYSVIQHFGRADARTTIAEIGRVLRSTGHSLVQMPTTFGLRCLYHQARRRFREPEGFDVRYWSVPALRKLFGASIGPTTISVDCFFGIGLQYSDRFLMSGSRKAAIVVSETLRRRSRTLPWLAYAADSVYVSSTKKLREAARPGAAHP